MTALTLSKHIATIGGAILVAWQVFSQTDAAILAHLDSSFASKQDLARLEQKIDALSNAVAAEQAAKH